MPNNSIRDAYSKILDTIDDLRAGRIDTQTAQGVFSGVNTISQLMNAEANMIKTAGAFLGSGFVPELNDDPFEKPIPQFALEGWRNCSFCKTPSSVSPDAASVNELVACDYCLERDVTVHFRMQLKAQNKTDNSAPINKSDIATRLVTSRITEAQKEILYYLKEQDGQATIGYEFGESKKTTVSRLLRLEQLRLIECIQRPLQRGDFPPDQRYKVTSEQLHCGIWKLTNTGMKLAA